MYEPNEEAKKKLENNFTYHPPKPDQIPRYEAIRGVGKTLSNLLVRLCPPSRELSLCLTHLEDAIFWANASIARNEPLTKD